MDGCCCLSSSNRGDDNDGHHHYCCHKSRGYSENVRCKVNHRMHRIGQTKRRIQFNGGGNAVHQPRNSEHGTPRVGLRSQPVEFHRPPPNYLKSRTASQTTDELHLR